jgi:hypothetical protein
VHSRELEQYSSSMRAWLSDQGAVVKLCLSVRDCWLTVSDAERRVDAVDTLLESAPPYLRDSLSGIRSPSDAHAALRPHLPT